MVYNRKQNSSKNKVFYRIKPDQRVLAICLQVVSKILIMNKPSLLASSIVQLHIKYCVLYTEVTVNQRPQCRIYKSTTSKKVLTDTLQKNSSGNKSNDKELIINFQSPETVSNFLLLSR